MSQSTIRTEATTLRMIYPRDYPPIDPRFTGEKDHAISDADAKRLKAWNDLITIDQDETIRRIELSAWLEHHPVDAAGVNRHYKTMAAYRELVLPALRNINRGTTGDADYVVGLFEKLREAYRQRHHIRPTPLDALAEAVLTDLQRKSPVLYRDVSLYDERYFALSDERTHLSAGVQEVVNAAAAAPPPYDKTYDELLDDDD